MIFCLASDKLHLRQTTNKQIVSFNLYDTHREYFTNTYDHGHSHDLIKDKKHIAAGFSYTLQYF